MKRARIFFLIFILLGPTFIINSVESSSEFFTLDLNTGWNQVSFPYVPDDPSFANIFSDVGFYQVLTWDGTSYTTPAAAEPGLGYWTLVLDDTTITVTDGDPLVGYELDLLPGWNMIGSIFHYTIDADLVFSGYYQLETWNGLSYVSTTIIEPGKAYWALVLVETHIVVDETSSIPTNSYPQASNLQILHEPPELFDAGEPHECRMWGMIAENLLGTAVLDHLINMPYSLKILGGTPYANVDSWGLAYFDTVADGFNVYRGGYDFEDNLLSAGDDPLFNVVADEIAASGERIAVGHVRNAASGAYDIPNPHPFIRQRGGKEWALSHNGVVSISILRSLIGLEYLSQFVPSVGVDWNDPDVVDTDLYLIWVLKNIEESGWSVIPGIAKAITDYYEAPGAGGAANFIMSDGEKIWGFVKGNSLWYLYDTTHTPAYSAVASQPPEGAPGDWIAMSDYNLVELSTDAAPVLIPDVRTLYPPTYDSLTASYTYYDEDGDPESGSEIRWYRDGDLQSGFNDAVTVPSGSTADGEEWYFTVRPSDGEDFGVLMTSPTVTVGDTVIV